MMEYWEPKQSQVVFKINEVDYQKLQKIRKIVCPDIKYTKIKFKQDIYSIGDNLLIRDSADGFLIGNNIYNFSALKRNNSLEKKVDK